MSKFSIRELYKEFDLNINQNEMNIISKNNDSEKQEEYLNDIEEDENDDNMIINDDFLFSKSYKSNNSFDTFDQHYMKEIKNQCLNSIKTDRSIYNRTGLNYHEIIKDIFISNYQTASTISELQKLKITNIINCASDICKNLNTSAVKIEYLNFQLKDTVSENIECLFFRCIKLINKVKEEKGRILIHCQMGISRSVSIVLAYLIYKNKWTYDRAFNFLHSKRGSANPNWGFYLQLKTFYERITLDCDRLEIFSVSHFSKEQHDLIVCRLIYHNINHKEEVHHSEESKDSFNEDSISNNDESNNEEDDEDKKKDIILNEKGMYIFAMKKKIFILEGKNISGKNYNIYKKTAIEYIDDIKAFENLGNETNINNIEIFRQEDFLSKYNEIINDKNISISFKEIDYIDKLYVD